MRTTLIQTRYDPLTAILLLSLSAVVLLTVSAGSCESVNQLLNGLSVWIPGPEKLASKTPHACQTKAMHSVFWLVVNPAAIIFAPFFAYSKSNKRMKSGAVVFICIVGGMMLGGLFDGALGSSSRFSRVMKGDVIANYLANMMILMVAASMWFSAVSALIASRRRKADQA
ncbi:hypothetical protein [Pseudomonas sp. BMS12]|uniref:hypothetical protein n=1 Tax=Pseudomonas sp. BMS12 TaxID=1796033 RepID=UPI001290897F|nr:hypothetical protein [Pseudomonas sp. BMS12]